MADFLEYLLFMFLRFIVRILPLSVSRRLGAALAWCALRVLGFRRRVTLDNLRHAFPDKDSGELHSIAVRAYQNYGISIVEMLWTGMASDEELRAFVRVSDPHAFDGYAGKGFTILSGHFGCFDQIPHGLRLFIGMPMHIIVQRQRNKLVDRVVDEARRRHGNSTIPMGPSAREVIRVLRSGGMIGALGDQSGPKEALFVDFFGRPAATHRGVAAFSLKTGTPLILVLMNRQDDGTCLVEVEEVDKTGIDQYTDDNIDELTRRHVELLEAAIRKSPDQWLWMHKRWKHTSSAPTRDQVPETMS